MKHRKSLLTILCVAAFAVGCNRSDSPPAAVSQQDYAYAQRADYVKAMKVQLTEVEKEMDQLSAKVEKANEAAREEAKPRFQALRDQAAKLNKHLDAAKDATESTWDDIKIAFRKGYDEFKEGFQQTRQWVSDKIAP